MFQNSIIACQCFQLPEALAGKPPVAPEHENSIVIRTPGNIAKRSAIMFFDFVTHAGAYGLVMPPSD